MDFLGFIDESLWVAIAFVVFIALIWKKAGAAMAALLDQRADEIKKNLDAARSLREEAQTELKKYQRLHREAADQAREITADAVAMAERIQRNAAEAAEVAIKRKEEQAAAKIQAMKAEVINELRNRATELTTSATEALITENLDKAAALELVKNDIDKIKKLG